MQKSFTLTALAAAMTLLGHGAHAQQQTPVFQLAPTVVIAPSMDAPLTVTTDPKAPRQPLPAHDGADFLKSIPGFSVIRKGGTDGDPVFRGFSGSRLGILLDGQEIYGGCGSRMDPPTAYVYPEQYDRVTIRKGPQSVLYGAGQSAGVVLFERDIKRFAEPGWKANASATFGRFGRNDQMADVRVGTPQFYVQAGATRADADNYRDGDGREIHSRYLRWSTNAAIGWTPDDNTRLELSAALSDGRAAYADRTMDGSKFRRENVSLSFEKRQVSPLLEKIEARVYRNYVDHVMDNYSLRPNAGERATQPSGGHGGSMGSGGGHGGMGHGASGMQGSGGHGAMQHGGGGHGGMGQGSSGHGGMGMGGMHGGMGSGTFSAMNPDRTTTGGRLALHLRPADALRVIAGVDAKHDRHRSRMTMNEYSASAADAYTDLNRAKTLEFRQYGVFAEATYDLDETRRVIGGARLDRHEAIDQRATAAHPGAKDSRTLPSGFLRLEQDFADGQGTFYAGLGHAQRFPDFWERMNKVRPDGSDAALRVRPEKTTQLDAGVTWKHGDLTLGVSGFYAHVQDHILIQWDKSPAVTRNINARILGGEIDLGYRLHPNWLAQASLAYVHGTNRTDGKALAQQPPLELRLGLNYETEQFSAGALWRVVAAQGRYDKGAGGIVGQDTGRSAGFGVLSLNAGWRPSKTVLLTAGVDNVLNKTYAEHLSRGGHDGITGADLHPANQRINEPGRTFWLKAQIAFD